LRTVIHALGGRAVRIDLVEAPGLR
jgi:hypothetical protein